MENLKDLHLPAMRERSVSTTLRQVTREFSVYRLGGSGG
jgi:hypothetical protein